MVRSVGALSDLWNSERGLLAAVIIVAATVLCALGRMPVSTWQETVVGVYGVYAVSKGATGVAQIWKGPADPSITTETKP